MAKSHSVGGGRRSWPFARQFVWPLGRLCDHSPLRRRLNVSSPRTERSELIFIHPVDTRSSVELGGSRELWDFCTPTIHLYTRNFPCCKPQACESEVSDPCCNVFCGNAKACLVPSVENAVTEKDAVVTALEHVPQLTPAQLVRTLFDTENCGIETCDYLAEQQKPFERKAQERTESEAGRRT
eukprot:1733017-Amphidinium_carterae.1